VTESSPPVAARPEEEPSWLDGLNPPQKQAVLTTEGPVLMLAGAGTGKTAALTARLAYLIRTGRAWPGEILCVTFTNKAAREMRQRVGQLIGEAVEGMPWLGTFHSICARMLRRHAELAGLRSNYTIIDTDDQLRVLKQLIAESDLDEKRWPARQLASLIDNWKNRGLTPDKLPAGEAQSFAGGKGGELYREYQQRLKVLNAADFGDLLLEVLRLFREHPDVLKDYQRRFKYMLVDEYQDTNVAQYLWLRLLAQGHRNICCVGDDDQSIYGWRGAEVDNILRFEKDFPGARVIRLERNYRSTPHILGAASGLIARNEGRLGKTLHTDREEGDPLTVRAHWDGDEEARAIGDDIESLQRKGERLNDMAILVRASFQMRAFEDRFITLGLPYRVVGGPRFYERAEIRDALAYFKVTAAPDNDLAFERIINVPKRGIGETTIAALHRHSSLLSISLFATALRISSFPDVSRTDSLELKKWIPLAPISSEPRVIEGVWVDEPEGSLTGSALPTISERAAVVAQGHASRFGLSLFDSYVDMKFASLVKKQSRLELSGLLQNFVRWQNNLKELSHTEVAEIILDESGYTEMWQNDRSPEAQGRLENLKELVRSMGEFETMAGFLEHIALVMDTDSLEAEDKVSIMTLHSAKGLEFGTVFLPGWEEGLFPHQRALDEKGRAGLEEERRLAYVGITRAKRRATISFAQNRRVHSMWQSALPSRFIDELPEKFVEVAAMATSYGGYGLGGFGQGRFDEAREPFANTYATPGWQRARERWASGGSVRSTPHFIEGQLTASDTSAADYSVGNRIFHQKFGYGRITRVDGNKLTIDFDKAGEKRVLDSFVSPA
jgi:DNA helicase-2/ATP-dependent DNA helicase PcrA